MNNGEAKFHLRSNARQEGIAEVRALLRKEYDSFSVGPKRVVGAFGVKDESGYTHKMFWVVSDRKDRRHGVVDLVDEMSNYSKDLFNTMFRKW